MNEIERKFLITKLPDQLESYPFHLIEQAYLTTNPVIRVRRQDDSYYLTYKGKGLMTREEYNLPLTPEAYQTLLSKADGTIISKKRVLIPLTPSKGNPFMPEKDSLIVELDLFSAPFENLIIAEVEFPDEETALAFLPPDWFGKEVTQDPAYHNSNMSRKVFS